MDSFRTTFTDITIVIIFAIVALLLLPGCQADFGPHRTNLEDSTAQETDDARKPGVSTTIPSDEPADPSSDAEPETTTTPQGPMFQRCGSATGSELRGSSDPTSPTPGPIGQWVAGRLGDGGYDRETEYWAYTFAPGDYLIVAEADRFDAFDAGIEIYHTNETGDRGDRIFIADRQADSHRGIKRISFDEETTVNMRIEPASGTQEYRLGIFKSGDAIPLLRFDNCPTIYDLELGTVISKDVIEKEDKAMEYVVGTLPKGKYTIKARATSTKASTTNLGIDVRMLGAGGDAEQLVDVLEINEIERDFDETGEFTLHREQQVILELDYSFTNNNIELVIVGS